MSDTNIPVSDEVWMELNRRKQRGDTFDDVLRRVLEMDDHSGQTVADKPSGAIDSAVAEPEERDTVPMSPDLPQTVDENEARKAIACAVDLIQANGAASKREIVSECMPKHPLGYKVPDLDSDDRYRGAWWRRVIVPALKEHRMIKEPPRGGSEWRLDG